MQLRSADPAVCTVEGRIRETTHKNLQYKHRMGDIWDEARAEGPSFSFLSWGYGLVACPVVGESCQIFEQLEGVTLSPDCLGFDMLTWNTTGVGAWEYI